MLITILIERTILYKYVTYVSLEILLKGVLDENGACKAVKGLFSQYVSNSLQEYVPGASLRSKDMGLLVVPDFRLDTFGRRSLQYAGPRKWRSLNTFKKGLKSGLFEKHY